MNRHVFAVLALLLVSTGCGRGLDDSLAGVTTSTAPPPTTSTTVAAIVVTTTTTAPPPPEPLVVWAEPGVVGALRLAAQEFTAALGIDVDVVTLDRRSIRSRIRTEFAGPNRPDVFAGPHTWLQELRERGIAQPVGLTPRVAEFVPIAVDAFRDGGEVYGLPYGMAATVLYRNTVLVDEAPSGFSQVKSACEGLGDQIVACVAVPTDDPIPGYAFLSAPGGYLVGRTADGGYDTADVGIDNAGAVAGAQVLAELVADEVVVAATTEDALAGFGAGTTAFLMTGPEAASSLPAQIPRATTALPLVSGETPVPLVEVFGFYANAEAGQPDAAGLFIREYLATPTTMEALYGAGVLAPAYAATAAAVTEGEAAASVLDSASRGVPIPPVVGIEEALAALQPGIAELLVVPEGDDPPTPADVLAAAATAVRDVLGG